MQPLPGRCGWAARGGRRRGLVATLLAAMLLPAAAPAAVTVVDDRGQHLTLAQPAQRIVTLLPSLTEAVCVLQACDRLVGVDRYSDWPTSVQALPKLAGLEDTPIERVVALKPDLVLVARSSRAIDRLEALGLRVLALEAANLSDTERVLEVVAQALGRPGAGRALWQRLDADISAAAARVPAALRGQRVYFEVSSSPHAAGAASYLGEMLARLGLVNVVPAAMGPYPQLNPEFVVRAGPDIVMATERAVSEMSRRPGWSGLAALREARVCGFATARYEIITRPGPRLAESAGFIADCLRGLRPAS